MSNIRMQIKDSIIHYLCDDWNNHKKGKAHKENQALFDRKDGYAIWNNIDLEMIMEKVVKGIYAVDLADHDKQIRDEVIGKLISEFHPCKDCISKKNGTCDDKDYFVDVCCEELNICYDDLLNFAEKMKGEQNE